MACDNIINYLNLNLNLFILCKDDNGFHLVGKYNFHKKLSSFVLWLVNNIDVESH